jgi:predicted negative regulator of RcsB-dependent stress response
MINLTPKINYIDRTIILVKKNLKFVILIFIFVLISLFGFLFYKNVQENNNIKIAENYTKASILIKQKKNEESKLLLKSIINKDHQLYSPLALYLVIDNNLEKDASKIIDSFDKILKNNSIDEENLNLIKIKKAIYLINVDDEKNVIETLSPIINSSSVWRNFSINLISEYFLSKGQKVKAKEYISLLKIETSK